MRIATIIAATLLLIITAGIGLLGTNRGLTDAKDINEKIAPMKSQLAQMAESGSEDAAKLVNLSEQTGRLKAGAVFFALTTIIALALMIMMFVDKAVPIAAVALIAMALIAVFVNPQYDLGPTAPASARSLAYVTGVIAALGAAAAYGASALKKRKLSKASA